MSVLWWTQNLAQKSLHLIRLYLIVFVSNLSSDHWNWRLIEWKLIQVNVWSNQMTQCNVVIWMWYGWHGSMKQWSNRYDGNTFSLLVVDNVQTNSSFQLIAETIKVLPFGPQIHEFGRDGEINHWFWVTFRLERQWLIPWLMNWTHPTNNIWDE